MYSETPPHCPNFFPAHGAGAAVCNRRFRSRQTAGRICARGWPSLRLRGRLQSAPSQLRRTAATSARQPLFQILRDRRELLHRRAPVLLEDGEDVLEALAGLTHLNCAGERRRLSGGARDSRAVSGDSPETPRGASENTQDFQICASSNLHAAHRHTRVGCLRRVAADSTRVACSSRKLPLAATAILMRQPWRKLSCLLPGK